MHTLAVATFLQLVVGPPVPTGQLLEPHFRLPSHWEFRSQTPSPATQRPSQVQQRLFTPKHLLVLMAEWSGYQLCMDRSVHVHWGQRFKEWHIFHPTRTNSAWKLDLEKRKKNTSSFGQGTFELRSSYIYVLKKRKNKLVDAQREVSSLHWVFINISGRVTKSKYTRIKRAYLKSCKLDLSIFSNWMV